MKTAAALLVAVAAVAVSARSVNFDPSDAELKGFVQRNYESLPDFVRDQPDRQMLRAYLSPAYAVVTHPEGQYTVEIDGAESDLNEARRAVEDLMKKQHRVPMVVEPAPSAKNTITPGDLWNIGLDVWNFVMDNKATVNATIDWGSAIPKGVTNFTKLTGFRSYKAPASTTIEFKNFLGMKLTSVSWSWYSSVAGQWNGVGAYLMNTGAAVDNIYAIDTEHISAVMNVLEPVNTGNATDPVAQLPLQMTVNSHGLFKSTSLACSVTIDGHGVLAVINCETHN